MEGCQSRASELCNSKVLHLLDAMVSLQVLRREGHHLSISGLSLVDLRSSWAIWPQIKTLQALVQTGFETQMVKRVLVEAANKDERRARRHSLGSVKTC